MTEFIDVEEQAQELLKEDTATLNKPLPTIKQLKKYIENDKELLKKQLEIIENQDPSDCVLQHMLKQKMAETVDRIQFYQFGIDMAVYGYKLSENKVSDKEAAALAAIFNRIMDSAGE